MLSFTVRMKFRAEDRDVVAALLRPLTLASRLEPGCVSYIAHFVEGEPATGPITVLIYEQYADEAALEEHRRTPHFERYAVEGLYRMMLDREIEHLTAIA